MATETKTFYPGAHEDATGLYGNIQNSNNPVGKGSNNTSYARIPSRGNTAAAYWPFDVSIVPVDATIDSVVCKVKAKGPSALGTSSGMQLYSGTTPKGSSVSAPSSAGTKDITAGAWTRSELSNIRLRTAVKGTSSSTSYFDFYGADLTVTYTYQSEKFMLKLFGDYKDIARTFKKANGIWVEQTDLANVIEDGVRYKNGGEYVAPATFTVDGVEYTMDEGMTWAEWIASDYNTAGFYVSANYGRICTSGGDYVYYYPYVGDVLTYNYAVNTLVISDGNGGNYFTW